jgi:hypothetical protein
MMQAKCFPLDNTPPSWGAKKGYMDFDPTKEELVVEKNKYI